ncbi:MAG: Tfp pilus assembly protein PilF [Myxococcota bacterium]
MSPDELLRTIQLAPAPLTPGGVTIQDFCPLNDSVETLVTQRYWLREGLRPFVQDEMPYVINNSGWAPEAAAAVLYDGLAALDSSLELVVLEVAAGVGLFARQVLDALAAADEANGGSVYARLRYIVTDYSAATVDGWVRSGQFDDHAAHVTLGRCDVRDLVVWGLDGTPITLPAPHTIVANYALDALPSTVVRLVDGELEELMVRTQLPWPEAEIRTRFGCSLKELRANLDSDTLLAVANELEIEAAFRPASAGISPWGMIVADHFPDSVPVSANFGALDFLTFAIGRLAPGGFVFLSDYGPVRMAEFGSLTFTHRFGHMTTNSVNFSFIDRYFHNSETEVYAARGDEDRSIHVRLIVQGDGPSNAWQTFLATMAHADYLDGDRRHLVATEHVAHGRYEAALEAFQRGIAICERDWYLLATAAQFLCQQLGRNDEALALAQQAAAINPWHSARVWNTVGNAQYRLGQFDAAADSFDRAFQIDSDDPQTLLNRAFILDGRGDEAGALQSIAAGLLADSAGRFRDSLLAKQAAIVGARAGRFAAAGAQIQRREAVLRAAGRE